MLHIFLREVLKVLFRRRKLKVSKRKMMVCEAEGAEVIDFYIQNMSAIQD